ncbi:MAG TPA: hypothetical protein VHL10_04265 [Nitrososphaera sp.]|jgi:hypothetical protein|nr:hypothetical protein [Nitrososphaera sp.]
MRESVRLQEARQHVKKLETDLQRYVDSFPRSASDDEILNAQRTKRLFKQIEAAERVVKQLERLEYRHR